MAELLYRLGKWSSRRAKTVLALWLALLVALAAVVGAVGINLSENLDVGQTETTQVADRLQAVMASSEREGGTDSVQMVASTANGEPFTDAQKAGIEENIAAAKKVEMVSDVVSPFATEQERADQARQIADGQKQLDAAKDKLQEGREQLKAGASQAEAAEAQLEAARKQAQAAGEAAYAAAKPQLDAQQAQLDAADEKLQASHEQLDSGEREVQAKQKQLDQGAELMDLAKGIKLVSDDGSTAIVTVTFTTSTGTAPAAAQNGIDDVFQDNAVDGVDFKLSAGASADASKLMGPGEVIGLVIAAVVLVIMLGTLLAAGLPILTALLGVGVGMMITVALGSFLEVASVTPMLGLMLGLAVGIDYSLFIVNRHRRQLRQGHGVIESVGLATGTSGNAVVFAGATVIVALLGLNITGLPFLGLMGTSAAVCVLIAVLMAITLTPALLGLAKERVLRKAERAAARAATPAASAEEHHAEEAAAIKVLPRWKAALAVVAGVVVLGVCALPVTDLRTGLPDNGSESHDSSAYQAYTTLADKFGAGQNSPLVVLADLPAGLDDAGVTQAQLHIARALKGMDNVTAVAPAATAEDKSAVVFQVIPSEGPSAESTEELVHALRAASPLEGEYPIGVAGMAAANIDMSAKIVSTLPAYLGVVIGLSFLILVLVFRSLLVPLIATLGFVLSYAAALGGVVAIFQWGWFGEFLGLGTPGPILSFLPTIMLGILFGLAMDYMLFLGSGMREAYAHGTEARAAVVQGVRAGRSVVIAAAIIMISVFGGFLFSHMSMVRPIGFALAFGVLADAFVVRLVIIPALMTILGKSAWWLPRWLDKILPNVDVEGAGLEARHPKQAPETAAAPETSAGAEAASVGR
ncbi:MMPL family transporter [Galactobacter valiniphilus]|uniref:MMPL family transporter n=1 Tax=Galactobacter valiniphilus TaxID=2676122 RepID=UPI0037362C86